MSINAKTNRVVGSTSVFLEGVNEYCRLRECNMGNFLTDSLVDYVSTVQFATVTKLLLSTDNINKKKKKIVL